MGKEHHEIANGFKFVVKRIPFVVGEIIPGAGCYVSSDVFQVLWIDEQIFLQTIGCTNGMIHEFDQLLINCPHNPRIDLMKIKTAAK